MSLANILISWFRTPQYVLMGEKKENGGGGERETEKERRGKPKK